MIPYTKILVPLDGSELAAQALPHAEAIARASGAKLILSQVVETSAGYLMAPAGVGPASLSTGVGVLISDDEGHRRAMDAAKAELDQVAASLKQHKIHVDVDVNTGDPAACIVDYAEENAVDLIVMSTHGRTGFGRWAYGSVTNKVLQAAPCAVLVVRPTAH